MIDFIIVVVVRLLGWREGGMRKNERKSNLHTSSCLDLQKHISVLILLSLSVSSVLA